MLVCVEKRLKHKYGGKRGHRFGSGCIVCWWSCGLGQCVPTHRRQSTFAPFTLLYHLIGQSNRVPILSSL